MRPKGFTLIELLVVIAIIAILAAILFPVFAKVREKARQTSCLSNEKQLGLGIAQYVEDFDETFPNGMGEGVPIPTLPGELGWTLQIYPYVNNVAVFSCPDDTKQAPDVSYGLNSELAFPSPVNNTTVIGRKISQLQQTANTIAIFEVNGFGDTAPNDTRNNLNNSLYASMSGNGNSSNGGYQYGELEIGTGLPAYAGSGNYATGVFPNSSGVAGTAPFSPQGGRHTDGANYLFADSHAKWLKSAVISAGMMNTSGSSSDCGNGPNNTNALVAAAPGASTCSYGLIAATFSP